MLKRAMTWIAAWYLAGAALVACGCTVLNHNARSQAGIWGYHEDFKRVILAGFDPDVATRGCPTFPMWGYGWLLLLSENKVLLVLLQQALALLAVWLFIRALQRNSILSDRQVTITKLLVVVALPWYALHSQAWPGSIATSLVVIGLSLLADLFHGRSVTLPRLIGSAALFGLAANFRADAGVFTGVMALVMLCYARWRLPAIAKTALWMVCIFGLLLPWVLYTKSVTGHFLLTTTNGGTVRLQGYGRVPDNPWGLTCDDNCPVILGKIRAELGYDAPPVTYEADQVLKKWFRELLRQEPGVFVRKCLATFRRHVIAGVHSGEFYRFVWDRDDGHEKYLDVRARLRTDPLTTVRAEGFAILVLFVQLYSALFGRVVVLLSFCLFVPVAVHALRARKGLLVVCLIAVAFRMALIVVLAHPESRYSSPAFLFHFLNCVVGASLVGAFLRHALSRFREGPQG